MLRFLLCSFALVLLYPTGIDLYLVGLPQIAKDLAASEAQLHIAFSVYLSGMAIAMFFAGSLSDKLGRKPLTIAGAALFAIASYSGGLAQSSNLFLAARFVQGMGAGACYVAAFAILRDTLDDVRRAKVLSMLNGIICIIPVLAPVVGYLIMLKLPWNSLFTTMAIMGLAVFLLCSFWLTESRQKMTNATQGSAEQLQERFITRFFISRLLISMAGITIILTYINISPFFIMEQLGFNRGQYSLTMALTALSSMLASFGAPYLLARFKQKSLILAAQILFLSAGLLFVMLQQGILPLQIGLAGFVLICTGFSLGFGVVMSQALSPFSARAGMASSILGIAQVCTSALYIWLMSLLGVSALTMLVLALVVGGILSIVLLLWVPLHNQIESHEEIADTT